MLRFLIGLCLLLSLASCEKVIDLKVGDSTPQVVIEGTITDTSTARVRLTRSVNFTESNTFPPITGAQVWVTDQTSGITDTLVDERNASGYYSPRAAYRGQPGHTYRLTVETEGQRYEATSAMPQPVPIDSIRVETSSAFGQTAAQLFVVFTDPSGIPNYYRFVLLANGKKQRTDVRDDRFADGRVNGRPSILPYDEAENIRSGTTVTVEMQGLDEATHKYFSTFGRADGNSAAPANPVTNISGDAQGYFGAMTIQRRTVVLP